MTDDKSWQPGTAIDDVPLKVTEERFAAESQRNRLRVNRAGAVPLASSAPPVVPERESTLQPGQTAQAGVRNPASASLPSRQQSIPVPARRSYGSILNLNDVPLRQTVTSPTEDYEQESIDRRARVRRARRIPLLWRVTIVLMLALAGGIWYSYLAVEQHSVITAELPGAATVSTIETQVLDFERRSSAALSDASDDAHRLAAEIRDRYQRWRASH